MNCIFLSDALRPPLSGIGRYSYELFQRLPTDPRVGAMQFLEKGRFVPRENLQQRMMSSANAAGASNATPSVLNRRLRAWLGASALVAGPYGRYMSYINRNAIRTRPKEPQQSLVFGPNYFAPVSGLPTAVTIHDLSTLFYPETHPAGRVKRVDAMVRTAIDNRFTILTDAHITRQDLINQCGANPALVRTVYLGVGENFSPVPAPLGDKALARHGLQRGKYLLSVSTLEPRKNLERLVKAYLQLPQQLTSEYPLVLVGASGWRNGALMELLDKGESSGRIKRLGYVEDEDLPVLYTGARAFAYVSLYEGFGLPVVEAMACACPVLTSSVSSMAEIAADVGCLVDPLDIDAIREGLNQVLCDEPWRSGAKAAGLARAATLTWENTLTTTVDVFELTVDNA